VHALKRLFYVSRVADSVTFDDAAVRQLLAQSQMCNRRLDITGMLAYSGRHFAQVLEGEASAIDALAARIVKDPRHAEVKIVFSQPITRRDFGDWAMGYVEGFGASEGIEALLQGQAAPEGGELFCAKLFADPRL
jgi:hypothetical protein